VLFLFEGVGGCDAGGGFVYFSGSFGACAVFVGLGVVGCLEGSGLAPWPG
jgi:hypothetical protein